MERAALACHVRDLDRDQQLVPVTLILAMPAMIVERLNPTYHAATVVGHMVEEQAGGGVVAIARDRDAEWRAAARHWMISAAPSGVLVVPSEVAPSA